MTIPNPKRALPGLALLLRDSFLWNFPWAVRRAQAKNPGLRSGAAFHNSIGQWRVPDSGWLSAEWRRLNEPARAGRAVCRKLRSRPSARFGATSVAVDDVSFLAPGGDFTVLLGPSGCGQVHDPAPDCRAGEPDGGANPYRRARCDRRAPGGPRSFHGVSVLCALPAPDGGGKYPLRSEGPPGCQRRSARSACAAAPTCLG